MEFLVVSSWSDGDKVYNVALPDGGHAGTRNRAEATRYPTREAAEQVASGKRGGLPEFVGNCVDVEPVG